MKELLSLRHSSDMSKPEYRNAVLEAVETLVALGFKEGSNPSLVDMVDNFIAQQEEDEKVLYGKPLTKSDLETEIQHLDEELTEVEAELAKVEDQIRLAEGDN